MCVYIYKSWAWCLMPVIPMLWGLRQQDFCEFKGRLDYKIRHCLKKQINPRKQKNIYTYECQR